MLAAVSRNAFISNLSPEQLRTNVPAAFAHQPHHRTSPTHTFIPTQRILDALQQSGFQPIAARQIPTRANSPMHARYVIRLRRRFENMDMQDSIPELLFINSHDGTIVCWGVSNRSTSAAL